MLKELQLVGANTKLPETEADKSIIIDKLKKSTSSSSTFRSKMNDIVEQVADFSKLYGGGTKN